MIEPLLLACFICGGLQAQERSVSRENQQWIQYYLQTKLSEKWTLLADGGYRWRNRLAQRTQYIMRLGAGFQILENVSLAAGFAHLGFYRESELNRVEFRLYQELQIQQKLGALKLGHRFRVEERIFQQVVNGNTVDPHQFNYRFRYRFNIRIPLFHFSDGSAKSDLSLGIADEVFLNSGRAVVYNFFDQNRLMIGPILQLNPQLSIRLTGNFQFSSTSETDSFKDTDVLWLGIIHKLDCTKNIRS